MAERFWIINSAPDSADASAVAASNAAAAFWIVLEKFGLSDFRSASVEEWLARDRRVPAVALFTSGATASLSVENFEALVRDGGGVFLEGPWPSFLDEAVGVDIDRSPPASAREAGSVQVHIDDETLGAALDSALGGMKGPSNSGAYEGPGTIRIRSRDRKPRRLSADPSRHAHLNKPASAPLWRLRRAVRRELSGRDAPHQEQFRSVMTCRSPSGDAASNPLLMRRGNLVVSSMEVLSYVMEDYTAPYLGDAYEFSSDRYPIEFALIVMLRALLADAAGPDAARVAQLRLAPWPHGARYALTVRHDVDRAPTRRQRRRLLAAEKRAVAGVSAYFLRETLKRDHVRKLERAGAEIGHHAAHLERAGEEERAAIARVAGSPVLGMSVHGNEGFYGWRGVAHWEEAERLGDLYVENLSSSRYLPSRVFRFDEEAQTVAYRPVALPHHVSFDRGMTGHFADAVKASAPTLARNEAHVVILNHPDINIDAFSELIVSNMPAGAAGFRAADAARWWRDTHISENFRYDITRATGDDLEIRVRARRPVFGASFDIGPGVEVNSVRINGRLVDAVVRPHAAALSPDGLRVTLPHLPEGETAMVISARQPEEAQGQSQVTAEILNALRAEMRAWYHEQNGGPPTETQLASIRHNIDKCNERRDELLAPLRQALIDHPPKAILDVGCGFGGLGLAFKSAFPAAALYLTDLSPRFFSAAEKAVDKTGLEGVTFDCHDVRDLPYQNAFDLVILSGMLNFLTSKTDLEKACRSAWRATKPGGHILVQTPHKWTYREPFTKLPLLQYLPRPLQTWLAVRLKRRSTMDDIRLPGAREIERIFADLGAVDIDTTPGSVWGRLRASHIMMRIRKKDWT